MRSLCSQRVTHKSCSLPMEKASLKFSSKYERILVPVSCEWKDHDGEVCGVQFSDVSTFSSHVRTHLSGPVTPAFCAWNGCDFASTDQQLILRHILFHPFHAFLKILGEEFQAKYELPACRIDEQYKNLVPPTSTPLKCQWNDGQCMAEFDGVGDFFLHTRDHVMGNDTGCSQCKWKG